MGFYIDIIMDKDVIFSENTGLADVIRYIGQKESKVSLSDSDALENGVRIVDKRLNRFHKKAIRRLIHSELKSFKCVGDEVKNKNVWKIHQWKAKRIFQAIHDILQKYDSTEVKKRFEEIRSDYFEDNANTIGEPYYTLMKNGDYLAIHEYNDMEIRCFNKCVNKIEQFNEF